MNNQNHIGAGLIQAAFESEFYPQLMSGAQTNDPAFRLVGQLCLHTQSAEHIEAIVLSGLPENYRGNTPDELPNMIARTLENQDKPKEASGKTVAGAMLAMVERAPIELFHDSMGTPYMTVRDQAGSKVYALESFAALLRLKKMYYQAHGKPIASQAFKEALDMMQANAIFDGPERSVYLRVARHEEGVAVNMADPESRAIIIDANGYSIANNAPVYFAPSSIMAAIPAPLAPNDDVLEEFRLLLNLSKEHFYRLLAFVINCWKPEGPYLVLLLEGEQGSGKSFLSQIIKTLVDPSRIPKMRLPKSEQDLMIQAKDNHVLAFDNVSGLKWDMSDALCSLSTGGGFSTRKLYTNDEQQLFFECRPVILNGINGIANRPDLLDRSISLKLPSIPKGQRKTEAEILERFEELRPYLMGKLSEIVSCALKNFDEVIPPTSIRMADAAKWLVAAEPATGFPDGTLLTALENSQTDIIVEAMSGNSLAVSLLKCVEDKPFLGTVGELYEKLEGSKSHYDRSFPPTSAHLSRALERLRPALIKTGIVIEFGAKTRKGRMVSVTLEDDNKLSWVEDASGDFEPKIGI